MKKLMPESCSFLFFVSFLFVIGYGNQNDACAIAYHYPTHTVLIFTNSRIPW